MPDRETCCIYGRCDIFPSTPQVYEDFKVRCGCCGKERGQHLPQHPHVLPPQVKRVCTGFRPTVFPYKHEQHEWYTHRDGEPITGKVEEVPWAPVTMKAPIKSVTVVNKSGKVVSWK